MLWLAQLSSVQFRLQTNLGPQEQAVGHALELVHVMYLQAGANGSYSTG